MVATFAVLHPHPIVFTLAVKSYTPRDFLRSNFCEQQAVLSPASVASRFFPPLHSITYHEPPLRTSIEKAQRCISSLYYVLQFAIFIPLIQLWYQTLERKFL